MGLTIKVDPGEKVRLAVTDTDRAAGVSKSAAKVRMDALSEQLGELQELLFAAHRHAVLLVLQGMDTSGKDGTIRMERRAARAGRDQARRAPRHAGGGQERHVGGGGR